MSSRIVVQMPENPLVVLCDRLPLELPCAAPDCQERIYKWLPSAAGEYLCSFSHENNCRTCIIDKKYNAD
jgi:hypothetical protein